MKTARYTLLFGLLAISSFAGCEEDEPTASPKAKGNELTGTWRLTSRQCFCPQSPVPNETVTFTATDIVFHRNGQLISQSPYDFTTGGLCLSNGSMLLLRFTYTLPSQQSATRKASITVDGDKLVMDYGSACDAPLDSYDRVQ